MAPDGSQWLLLIQTHAVVGSHWLSMASNDFRHMSLLPIHTPKWINMDDYNCYGTDFFR